MKLSFEYIEAQFDTIASSCNDADCFAMTWKNFLNSCGWTEDEYEKELDRRLFNQDLVN